MRQIWLAGGGGEGSVERVQTLCDGGRDVDEFVSLVLRKDSEWWFVLFPEELCNGTDDLLQPVGTQATAILVSDTKSPDLTEVNPWHEERLKSSSSTAKLANLDEPL